MPAGGCEFTSSVSTYLHGRLSEEASHRVEEHLSICASCRAVADTLDFADDDFVLALRRPDVSEDFTGDPACQRMLARAKRLDPGSLSTIHSDSAQACETPAAGDEHPLAIGFRIGGYVINEKLAHGGMGVVYKAEHSKLRRTAVVKVLLEHRSRTRPAIARFHREMEAIGRLDHPNIVRAHEAGEQDGLHFLIMEFIEGTDLSRLLPKNGPFSVASACEIVRQAAVGLQYAHDRGIVHRDIKPSNLMLTPAGVVKVLDLGLAKVARIDRLDEPSTATHLVGTLDYLAPELADLDVSVTPAADIYSLGCTLYALLSGRPPFAAVGIRNPLKKLSAHAQQVPPPIPRRSSDLPVRLQKIVRKMLAKSPGDRFATASDVAIALQPFCDGADLAGLISNNGASNALATTHPSSPNRSVVVDTPPGADGLRRRRAWLVAVMLAIAASVLCIRIVYRSTTVDGTLVVELENDNPDANLRGERVTIRDEAAGREYTITLRGSRSTAKIKPGAYVTVISDAGLTLDPPSFVIHPNGHVTVRLTLANEEDDVVDKPDPLVSDPKRKAGPNERKPKDTQTGLLPSYVNDFDGNQVIVDGPTLTRSIAGGLYRIDYRHAGAGRLVWNVRKYDECIIEVVARVGEGFAGGWIVNLANPSSRHGVRIEIDCNRGINVSPNLFDPDKSFGPTVPRVEVPAMLPTGRYNRLRLAVKRRSIDIFMNSVRACETVRCDFDLVPGILSLGVAGGGRFGPARVEFDRVAIWPTTDVDAIETEISGQAPDGH